MIVQYPAELYTQLEFDDILREAIRHCLSEKAKSAFERLPVWTDQTMIQNLLQEVAVYAQALQNGDILPISTFEDVDDDLPLLRKEGYVLEIEAIQRIALIMQISKGVHDFTIRPEMKSQYPELFGIVEPAFIDAMLIRAIDKVIDEEGEVKPDASPTLQKISSKIKSKERELDKVFDRMVQTLLPKGVLADTVESMRNGRRVLTVQAEHKRKIQGIIHDESATGKTVYIEPQEVQQINNEIFNLYAERKQEIYKIIKQLCDELRPYADDILMAQEVLVRLDIIRAKARLAQDLEAVKPKVSKKPQITLQEAFHPVLKLKNDRLGKVTIPFDMQLLGTNRILVISGPNAGGKSVTMKAVGLLQMMVQSGFLVPVNRDTVFGIFDKIFADIGDQQSMEDDLSTYSSRLKNMKYFVEHTDEKTLFLIDEFGSGTDPKMGGAIAEGILRSLNYQKGFGVINTHYSNIKYYAFKTKGVLNASLEFDKATISPTYQLKVGSPGSSFAFEVAQKIGLPEELINYAKHKSGKNEQAIDELLVELQTERRELQQKMEKLLDREKQLERLTSNYEQLHKELEFRRKKIKLEQRERKLKQVDDENRELQKVIRELRKAKDLEEAEAKLKAIKEAKAELIEDIVDIKEDIFVQESKGQDQLTEGSYAKLRNSDAEGKILSIEKDIVEMEMGIMKVKVPLRDLIPIRKPLIENRTRSVQTDLVAVNSGFDRKLDVRGYTISDAMDSVQEFMDNALIHNISDLKIIHGIGSGKLRKSIHSKLREYRDIKRIYHPEEEFGGVGVTYIQM